MCLGVPAQIVDISSPQRAKVSLGGVQRMISTDLVVEPLSVGDWVLVHVGFALSIIDEKEAQETLRQIKQLGAGTYDDELASFKGSAI